MYQRLIPTGERSGLQMHIAMTESVLLCARMKSSPRFWSWNRQFALSVHKIQTNHCFRSSGSLHRMVWAAWSWLSEMHLLFRLANDELENHSLVRTFAERLLHVTRHGDHQVINNVT